MADQNPTTPSLTKEEIATVLALIIAERDRVANSIDRSLATWAEPNCPHYKWFDEAEWARDARGRLATLNSIINRIPMTASNCHSSKLVLSAAIQRLVQHHVLTVGVAIQELTDDDVACGNTEEWQGGYRAALEMVTRDYVEPLVSAHNEAVGALNV